MLWVENVPGYITTSNSVVNLSNLVTVDLSIDSHVLAFFVSIGAFVLVYILLNGIVLKSLPIKLRYEYDGFICGVLGVMLTIIYCCASLVAIGFITQHIATDKCQPFYKDNTARVVKVYADKVLDDDNFIVQIDKYDYYPSVLDNRICLQLKYPNHIITNTAAFKVSKLTYIEGTPYIQYIRIDDEKIVNELIKDNTMKDIDIDATKNDVPINNAGVDVNVNVDVKVDTTGGSN